MRAAITAGITQAMTESDSRLEGGGGDFTEDDFILLATNRVLEALAAAGHIVDDVTILPQDTPVTVLSLTDVIAAAAATNALNADTPAPHRTTADLYEDEFGNTSDADHDEDGDQSLGACILTGQEGENEDDCTTHNHENTDGFDPYANFTPYQIPADTDLRQVRNLVRAIAPLFGTAVYYRYNPDTGARVMDVVSPTAVKDVFTQTITGLTAACRQHITEQRIYPRAAATLYATIGTMLADDLDSNPTFQDLRSDLPAARTLLRMQATGPVRRLSFVPAADDASEIAGTARILLIENTPTI